VAYVQNMNDDPEIHEISARIIRVEERMNTMQSDLSASLERFRADSAVLREDIIKRDKEQSERYSLLREDIIKRDKEQSERYSLLREDIAKRDRATVQWIVGVVFGAALLIIAVTGLMIRFPVG